ncbi:uncharacterized protein LOC9662784 isoform X2 [Selaginella moellendorffii]|uniref:uncharacterized protein LOC9662784 isoform X2 n=1 Tax=Selaginella moellendorffii TaxID=88036 RepID=UPI000D1C4B80|nr:uncharacterized protein LOC9662784 isoform X2 [Selaginella moellendorffii]|eukprot:XP_024516650.1 uncharacterized protein LOC9662784 isoform X2 [Selaginella moellendorffii]
MAILELGRDCVRQASGTRSRKSFARAFCSFQAERLQCGSARSIPGRIIGAALAASLCCESSASKLCSDNEHGAGNTPHSRGVSPAARLFLFHHTKWCEKRFVNKLLVVLLDCIIDNGLRVFLLEDHELGLVGGNLIVKGGGNLEPEGKWRDCVTSKRFIRFRTGVHGSSNRSIVQWWEYGCRLSLP